MNSPGIRIDGFAGSVWLRDDAESPDAYQRAAYQYATSFQGAERMRPLAILQATSDEDVVRVINYARSSGLAVAVRSGGHHYTGASSTGGQNIQLDMSRFTEAHFDPDSNTATLGAGNTVERLSQWLKENQIFVPHGQCPGVAVGGHVQSGGWGTVRSLGLLIDHVLSFDIVTADGVQRQPSRDASDPLDRELFWGVLGGSPGDFGVITRIRVKVMRDADHPNAHGFKLTYLYSDALFQRLMRAMVKLADRADEIPADYDFAVVTVGANTARHRGIDREMMGARKWHPAAIVVVGTWMNLNGRAEAYDPQNPWFALLRNAIAGARPVKVLLDDADPCAPSAIFAALVSDAHRAFPLPYVGHDFALTESRLDATDFADWFSKRVRAATPTLAQSIINRLSFGRLGYPERRGIHVQTFAQACGGRPSRFARVSGENAFSWRNCRMWVSLIAFYDGPDARGSAQAWGDENHRHIASTYGDRRFVWVPFVEPGRSLDELKDRFFGPDPGIYERLRNLKAQVDPSGVFSSGAFRLGGKE